MMKRLLVAFAAIAMLALPGVAQEETQGKPNVLIDYFSRPASIPFKWAETVRTSVMQGLHNSNRVSIIDIDANDALKVEQERREEENLSAGDNIDRLAVMQQEGAEYVLQGVINDITISKTTTSSATTYDPVYAFTLKVIDAKTGKIVATDSFKAPNGIFDLTGFTCIAYSPDEAVTAYSVIIPKKIQKFIRSAFPIQGSVLELAEVRGDNVKTLYISVGDVLGAKKGQKYEVREVRTIGGKESRRLIGEVEVSDVEGDELSLCKVKRGGQDIVKSFNAGNKLIITSME